MAVGFFHRRSDRLSGRFAILVDSTHKFATMRMAGAFSELAGLVLRIFPDEGEALAWLDEVGRPARDDRPPGQLPER